MRPYVRGSVLEVGAGIGANISKFSELPSVSKGLALEPNVRLFEAGKKRLGGNAKVSWKCGSLADLPADQKFDTILYIDVLEHIEDDRAELVRASQHLNPGGYLGVLSPARPDLMSEFDRAVGHYRRYLAEDYRKLTPEGLSMVKVAYLDSLGLFLSLGNRLVLKSSSPKLGQILFWDRWVVPVSRMLDPLIGHRVGKTVIGIWKKGSPQPTQ
jgi:SAM-dependent methyltransferase